VRGESDTLTVDVDRCEEVQVHRLNLTNTRSPISFRNSFDHPEIESYIRGLLINQRFDVLHLISGYLVTGCAISAALVCQVPMVVTLTDYWFICPRINLIRSTGEMCGGPYNALDCTRCLLVQSRRYRIPEQVLPPLANLAWRFFERSRKLRRYLPLYEEVARREHLLIERLNSADAITIPTNSLRPRLVRAGVADCFQLSRHGIIPQDLGIQSAEKSISSLLRFGYLGQVLSSKGVDLLARAYQRLVVEYGEISLSIWGEASDQSAYVTKLKAMLKGVPRAAMMGRYEPAQLGDILQEIDVLVVPSRWPEIGPFTILEAFAAKTPVIAARIGNMPELVEHGINGLLFEPDSSADLYAQMRRFLDEPNLVEKLRSGIRDVRTHDDEMSEVMDIYARVISRKVVLGRAQTL